MMSFLDRRPLSLEDADGRELLAALLAVYDQAPTARRIVLAAGMSPAQFSWTSPMAEVWPEILRKAANQERLRQLIDVIADDPDSRAYTVFARLAATPVIAIRPAQAPATEATKYETASVRRLVASALSDDEITELCIDHFPAVYDQFSQGMTRSQKVIRLVEYCSRRGQLPYLTQLVGEINPDQFGKFMAEQRNQSGT